MAGDRPQVFILRIWYEAQEAGQREVRIQARYVVTGETRYFREWPALVVYLVGKLEAAYPILGQGSTTGCEDGA